MMFSTLVSLIAVPWAYMLFDDMRNYFKRLIGGIMIKKQDRIDGAIQPEMVVSGENK